MTSNEEYILYKHLLKVLRDEIIKLRIDVRKLNDEFSNKSNDE